MNAARTRQMGWMNMGVISSALQGTRQLFSAGDRSNFLAVDEMSTASTTKSEATEDWSNFRVSY